MNRPEAPTEQGRSGISTIAEYAVHELQNADKLDATFAPFIRSAQKLGNAKKSGATQAPVKTGVATRSPEQFQAIRDWANSNGYEVSGRGRIKKEIVEAFDAAH